MIEKIRARNFKGLNFEQGVGAKNLIVGPNGSGKSARTLALLLALSGTVPDVGKRNQDVYEALGNGQELVAEVTIQGRAFERTFHRGEKNISQTFRINKQKVGKAEFEKALAKAPAPEVMDLQAFIESSDAKKVSWLFKRFPPEGDVGQLEKEIDQRQTQKKRMEEEALANKRSAQNLRKARTEISLPSWTLAEVTDKIKHTEEELKEARENLEQARAEEREAERQAEAEAQQSMEAEDLTHGQWEKQDKGEGARGFVGPNPLEEAPDPFLDEPVRCSFPKQAQEIVRRSTNQRPAPADPAESIRAIMASMDRTGCGACAAKLICKRELRKFKEVAPA